MAGRQYINPFQASEISIPQEFHEDMVRYCQREARANVDHSPFPRMVDMWFLAVCLAARDGVKPAESGKTKTVKIIEGSIFGNDPWRVQMLLMLAIAIEGRVEVVSEPARIMKLVNGLAIAGMPKVLDMLKEKAGDPIWNLSESIDRLLRKG